MVERKRSKSIELGDGVEEGRIEAIRSCSGAFEFVRLFGGRGVEAEDDLAMFES